MKHTFKKAFTMVELIFVIVALGILASIAIPRLGATRTDAEVTSTLANIKTILSDVSAYYAIKGDFDSNGEKISWNVFTNVPLYNANGKKVSQNDKVNTPAILRVNNKNCIEIAINEANGKIPAYVSFKAIGNSSICNAVKNTNEIKQLTNNKILDLEGNVVALKNNADGAVVIGASASIFAFNDNNTSIDNNNTGGGTTGSGIDNNSTGGNGGITGTGGTDNNSTGIGGGTTGGNGGTTTGGGGVDNNNTTDGNGGITGTGGTDNNSTGTGGTDNNSTGTGGNGIDNNSTSSSGGGTITKPTLKEEVEALVAKIKAEYNIVIEYNAETAVQKHEGFKAFEYYSEDELEIVKRYLTVFETEVSKYPKTMFQFMPLEFVLGKYNPSENSGITYNKYNNTKNIYLTLASESDFPSNIHHELTHYFDNALASIGEKVADMEQFNPNDFWYYDSSLHRFIWDGTNKDKACVIIYYGMNGDREDRATIWEHLFFDDKIEAYQQGTIIRNKAEAILNSFIDGFKLNEQEIAELKSNLNLYK